MNRRQNLLLALLLATTAAACSPPPEPQFDLAALQRDIQQKTERMYWIHLRLDTAAALLDAAKRRYERGVSDYLPVLTQILSVQGLERTLIQRKADLLVARVNLYRALGGDWTAELMPRSDAPNH